MANIIRKWRRVTAVGCLHGNLVNPGIQKQVLAFVKDFKPEIRFELGDVLDTAAMRAGAKGTPDEGKSLKQDYIAGVHWLKQYEPTHISWGNHDARIVELCEARSAVVAQAAESVWEELQKTVRSLKAKTVPYDYEHGWFEMGGTYFGHGYWYNEASVRDHAEFLGGPVVMAHLHYAQQVSGRTRNPSPSFCVGTLANIEAMHYARRRRATARWSHGIVWGEICDKASNLNLTYCPKGGSLRFPI